MKIYTRTGDKGETGLWGGSRVSKDHPRVRAYGEVDELNSWIGLALAALAQERPAEGEPLKLLSEELTRVQAELFQAGAILATPGSKTDKLGKDLDRGLPNSAIERLEAEIDGLTRELWPLKRFILPGGSKAGALLHLARAVCRRAERQVVALGPSAEPESRETLSSVVVYLNRLSDFLFTAARWANAKLKAGETEWESKKP